MSGIAAVLNSTGCPVDENLIIDMASLMSTRGPRYQHYWLDGAIALAHTSLVSSPYSSSDSQPSTLEGQVWISADARIDGRSDLLTKIKAYQPNIRNDLSDDQLILHAYRIWGVDCLGKFIGDFCFTLWDKSKQRLLCATDQFGVSPLYYAHTSQGLCISNTLNAIRLHPDISSELNELTIADYLMFRINHTPDSTFFTQIKHMPAAHCLLYENGHTSIKPYWCLNEKQEIHYTKPNEYLDEFGYLLKQAVTDRSSVDSVGVHLSGGMDSSSVAALCNINATQQQIPKQVVAYTYGASGGLPDLESPFAREVAEQYNIEHHTLEAGDELNAPPAPDHLHSPEPRFTSRHTSNYRLLNHVNKHSNVLLTGFGGDPLLQAGKTGWQDVNSPRKMGYLLNLIFYHWANHGKRPSLGLNRHRQFKQSQKRIANQQAPSWLHHDFIERHQLHERLKEILSRNANPYQSHQLMTNAGLWRRVFCWNDPGFTHIPIKVRHPFFDIRLLEYAQRLPAIPWLYNKTILRETMRPILPTSLIERPKVPLPGNGLQAVLSGSKDKSTRYIELLDNAQLTKYIDINEIKSKFNVTQRSIRSDFKAIIRVVTLSDWLTGYEKSPISFKFNWDHSNVKRIEYRNQTR